MADKPDGKPAKVERVTFTREAAGRIAKIVRRVESGDRDCGPLTFERTGSGRGSPLRVATFTGNWQTAEWKTVTLVGSTQTASVYNWCNPVTGGDTASTTKTRYVVFGTASGTQSAVEVQLRSSSATCVMSLGGVDLTQLAGYSSSNVQVLGHNTTGPCLQWYSVTTCSTAAS